MGAHTTDTSLIGCREMLALYLSAVLEDERNTPPRPARCGVSEARSALVRRRSAHPLFCGTKVSPTHCRVHGGQCALVRPWCALVRVRCALV